MRLAATAFAMQSQGTTICAASCFELQVSREFRRSVPGDRVRSDSAHTSDARLGHSDNYPDQRSRFAEIVETAK